ncbi:MAG: S9 family peptidase, partial [candidate division Zixibacteria bacterium]|nr:S9 family peptidase [candidate division Zixibacteria bacterium]
SEFVTMVEDVEAMYQAYPLNDRVLILTNEGAPMYRLMEASLENPQRSAWREIVPESEFKIENISPVGDKIILSRLVNASSKIELCDRDGKLIKEIILPTIGSVGEVSGEVNGSEFFLDFSSYFVPPAVYRYDLNLNKLELFDRVSADIDESLYQSELISFPSKDGTEVTMFVVSRKDIVKNEQTPALLYGYGGFNQSRTPSFARNRFLFLEQGGIYIDVHLRGGGEYGEAWHKAGMLDNKQNTFDDFIAAAEYLIKKGYTSKEKLVIQGGSNGGLLVGAALVQRPDLFSVVVCQVPLLDMVRYHKFLIARLWIPEYGDPDKPEDFEYIYKYSPYHHVEDGASYPSIMILTGESDTRVDPLHARKMTALLQSANSNGNPILMRVEKKSGHGQGSPLSKILDTYTDIWSFVFWRLGIEPS